MTSYDFGALKIENLSSTVTTNDVNQFFNNCGLVDGSIRFRNGKIHNRRECAVLF